MYIKKLEAKMNWAEKYIKEFSENNQFDPYATMMETETKDQKLYIICVDFTFDVQNYIEERCKDFDSKRNKIIAGLEVNMEEKYRYAIMAYEKDSDVWENIGGYNPDYSLAVQKARALAVAMRNGNLVRHKIQNGICEYEPFDRIEVWDTKYNDKLVFVDY